MREAQREIEQAQREMIREQARAAASYHPEQWFGSRQWEWQWRRRRLGQTCHCAGDAHVSPSAGAPRVSITTFDGQVTVHGWDKSEVTYTATKHANDEESSQTDFNPRPTAGPGHLDQRHRLTTTSRTAASVSTFMCRGNRLFMFHPVTARLISKASTGEITLRSGDGPIEVANGGGQLQVNTGDGVIRVIKFDGQVDARTGDGEIALDGNFNALSARTGDGTISFTVPAGSSFTIETNAPDEISNEGFVVAEDITPSPRVKRWRDRQRREGVRS